MRVGILYDNISGNTGDVAIGISVKKILKELKVEFEELVPGRSNPSDYKTIIIGGGHLLRPSPDAYYDSFKVKGMHILNAVGVVGYPDDLHYLNEYLYVTFRSNGDKNKVSYIKKDCYVVPCTSMLLEDIKEVPVKIEKPCVGIHLLPNQFSAEDEIKFRNWISRLPFMVYFIPITHYNNDYSYLEKLSRNMKNVELLPKMGALEIFTIIGKFSFFISCSLHGAIFAFVHNVPFILYDTEKMRFFLEDRKLSRYLFSSLEEMMRLFDNLVKNPPDYSKKLELDKLVLRNHIKNIKEIVGSIR